MDLIKKGVLIMGIILFSSCLREKVGYVEVKGTLTEDSQKKVLEWLDKLGETGGLRGVLVKVNSPGGSAAVSYEIYRKIKKLKEKGLKIVVYISEIGASGGYFVSCAGDYIIANPTSIVGSIGVITIVPDITKLLDKLGVKIKIVKKGKYKDIVNPLSPMTPEQEKYLDNLLNDVYEQFMKIVAESRNMSIDKVKDLGEGKIYTGRQAYKLGLVDTIGSFSDAVKKLKELNNIKKPILWLKMKEKKSLLKKLLEDFSSIKIWY